LFLFASRHKHRDKSLTTPPRFFIGPFVTSVGGTTDNPEVAAIFSGGGFSNYFDIPDYQENAVSTFLQNLGDKYNGLYRLVHGPDLI